MDDFEALLIERTAKETKLEVVDAGWYENDDDTWSWMFWSVGQLRWTKTVRTRADIAIIEAVSANQDQLRRQLEVVRHETCDPLGRNGAHLLHEPELTHATTHPHVYACECGAKWTWDGLTLLPARLSNAQVDAALSDV